MKREIKGLVLFSLGIIIFLTLFMTFILLSSHDQWEQDGTLLLSLNLVCIYLVIPMLIYRSNIAKKIEEVKRSLRYCYKCGASLKPNEVDYCRNCEYVFPFDKLS